LKAGLANNWILLCKLAFYFRKFKKEKLPEKAFAFWQASAKLENSEKIFSDCFEEFKNNYFYLPKKKIRQISQEIEKIKKCHQIILSQFWQSYLMN